MDITARNFLRLLCSGAFHEEVEIEPMSAWKWRRTYQYSIMHGVTALLFDGIQNCKQQFFLQIPTDLLEQWKSTTTEIEQKNLQMVSSIQQLYVTFSSQQLRPILFKGFRLAFLYDIPSHRLSQGIKIFFPFSTQGHKADLWALDHGTSSDDSKSHELSYMWKGIPIEHHHQLHRLTNKLLDHSLQAIIEKEIRESEVLFVSIEGVRVEVTSNTLTLLQILLDIARHILNNGVSLKQYVDLGILLRKVGDKVDYVKLQHWIDKLGLKKIAQISGQMLMELFNFTADEIPFMNANKLDTRSTQLKDELFSMQSAPQRDWYFSQGKDIFVHASNSSAMMWQVRHSARYFRYYPSESITNIFTSFTQSLSSIEE